MIHVSSSIRANVAGYTESVKKNRLTYAFPDQDADGNPVPPTPVGTGYQDLADLSIKSTDERETHQNEVYVAELLNWRLQKLTLHPEPRQTASR